MSIDVFLWCICCPCRWWA